MRRVVALRKKLLVLLVAAAVVVVDVASTGLFGALFDHLHDDGEAY